MKIAGLLAHQGNAIPYTVVRSRRRRRTVALSVKQGLGLRILAPVRISEREIAQLLRRRAGWIRKQFHRLEQEAAIAPLTEEDRRRAAFRRQEAEHILQARLDYWAKQLGVRHQGLKISNARRLWGSCSPKNSIRINWRITLAPQEAMDYLLVHELCHIPHKNHGACFWQKVAKHLPDYKARQKTLRAVEKQLLAAFR